MSELQIEIMSERKKEIGNIIFEDEIDTDKLNDLSIQEIIFAIRICEYYNENYQINDYEHKYLILQDYLVSKIKNADILFTTQNRDNQLPFINSGCIDVYSKKNIAEQAVKYYVLENKYLEVVTEVMSPNDYGILKFFYVYGIKKIRIDMGAYSTELDLERVLEAKRIKGVTANPKLRFAMIQYLETTHLNKDNARIIEEMQKKERMMIDEIRQAKFLLPVQFEEDKKEDLRMASLGSKSGELYIPIFTDWIAFQSQYSIKEWKGMLLDYEEIRNLIQGTGIVINPQNENIALSFDLLSHC